MELSTPHRRIRLEEAPGVLRITLARAERQNSIDGLFLEEVHAALDRAESIPECRLVVLEAEGEVFCSGLDLPAAAGETGDRGALASRGGADFLGLLKRFSTIPRVVLSRVDGRVSGGGVGIVAASDLAFATERSRFGLPEALWGLLPCCVLPFLIRRVGFQRAYAMTLSTLPVDAGEARRSHLVDEVADDAEPLIRRLLFRLEKVDETTVRSLKRYFARMWFLSDEMEEAALEEFARLMSSDAVQQRIEDYVIHQRFPWED